MKKVRDESEVKEYLGRLEFVCRPRTKRDAGDFAQLVPGAIIVAFVALVLSTPIVSAMNLEGPPMQEPLFYAFFVPIFGLLVCVLYFLDRYCFEKGMFVKVLAAHERGVQYGNKAVLYEEIAAVREGTAMHNSMSWFGKFVFGRNAQVRAVNDAAYTIELKSGEMVTLKMVKRQYLIDDVHRLLRRIAEDTSPDRNWPARVRADDTEPPRLKGPSGSL